MKLNELQPNEGAVKGRMRLGRGIGSGKGKTCGRGMKGQKSREGVSIGGFEGGQMPLYQRLPKRGFRKYKPARYAEVNLGTLQKMIDAKKLDAKKPIDAKVLLESGVIRRELDGVRLLGKGELKTKVEITVAGASKGAIAAVEKAGGKVTVFVKEVKPVNLPKEARKAAPKKEDAPADAPKADAKASEEE